MRKDLAWLGHLLAIDGDFLSAVPYGSGHINDTFAASYDMHAAGPPRRYIHQRINTEVFREPVALMSNLARVTAHIHAQLAARGVDDADRRALTLVLTRDGDDFVVDEDGRYWRTFDFIEDTVTRDVVETPQQAAEVARAFGEFQRQLADLDAPPLVATIVGFHDTAARLSAFRQAVDANAHGRAARVAEEIRRVEGYADLAERVPALRRSGALSDRIVHNDTKINNLLLDRHTGEGLCVIDLDTVMPGLAIDDFGDLVRTSTCFAQEDGRDLGRAQVDLALFGGLVRGYLSAAGGFLSTTEIDCLVLGGKLMTYEMALRFLGDHLAGDTYFRVHREGHNLDRARVQLALLDSIIANESSMEDMVARTAEQVV